MKLLANTFLFLVLIAIVGYWSVWLFDLNISSIPQLSAFAIGTKNPLINSAMGLSFGVGLLLIAYFWKGTKYLNSVLPLMFGLLITNLIILLTNGFSLELLLLAVVAALTIGVCRWLLLKHPTPKDYLDEIHPDFRVFRFIYINFKPIWRKRLINKIIRQKYEAATISEDIIIKTYEIKGYEERPVKIEVFEHKDAKQNAPCIIVYPGGGFWAAAVPSYKYLFNKLIKGTDAKIVFVHYTLALEAHYPAAHEDCYLATLWTHQNATMLGINNEKIAVYGISSGGTLAASVVLMLRDRGQFLPCFQMLIYPLLDFRMQTKSAKKYIGMAGWRENMLEDGINTYLPKGRKDLPYYALYEFDLTDLPEAYIEAAEYDCLRDEAQIYAERLNDAGIKTAYHEIKDAVHGFDLVLKSEITKTQIKKRIAVLNEVFR